MNLGKFFKTESGKHIMSAILGFGLATMFRVVCKDRNCLIFKAPNLEDIDDKVFQQGDKCYTFKVKNVKCKEGVRSVEA
jgi:hypothetical protein